jgi:hypothetical protein
VVGRAGWTKVAEIKETHAYDLLLALSEGAGGGLHDENYLADGVQGKISYQGQEYQITVKPVGNNG